MAQRNNGVLFLCHRCEYRAAEKKFKAAKKDNTENPSNRTLPDNVIPHQWKADGVVLDSYCDDIVQWYHEIPGQSRAHVVGIRCLHLPKVCLSVLVSFFTICDVVMHKFV